MSIIDTVAGLGTGLLPLIGAIGGAISGSKFVQEGQRGVKLRFGKVVRTRDGQPKVINPGFVFVIPSIEHLHRTHVRARTLSLPVQDVILADKLVFTVSGMVQVRVRDTPDGVYAALFETNGLNETVMDYVSGQLRDVISEQTYETAPDRELIATKVTDGITRQLAEWGVEVIDFRLTDCAPTTQSARAILIGVETRMRGQALRDVATELVGHDAVKHLPSSVAAALIGTPVVTALGNTVSASERDVDDSDD